MQRTKSGAAPLQSAHGNRDWTLPAVAPARSDLAPPPLESRMVEGRCGRLRREGRSCGWRRRRGNACMRGTRRSRGTCRPSASRRKTARAPAAGAGEAKDDVTRSKAKERAFGIETIHSSIKRLFSERD
jgi:hypothetical protein